MIRKIACILALSAALPLAAEAQQAPPAPTKADVQKVVQIISGDKAKLATYCKLADLDQQMAQADQAGDKSKIDALDKQAQSLQDSLGPEYAKMAAGLDGVDPTSAQGKDLLSVLEGLDKSCGK
jgi:phosphate-selective porin